MITVWEFRSVDGLQIIRVEKPAYPDDRKFEHEYQRIIYRGTDRKLAAQAMFS